MMRQFTRWTTLPFAVLLALGLTACDELTTAEDTVPGQTGVPTDPGQTGGLPTGVEPPSSGIDTDELTGIDDGTVQANILGLEGPFLVGSPITLDGSASTNTTEDELMFSWTVRERPSGSVAAIADPEAEITTFTPDRPGEYRIRLVVRAGAFESVDSAGFQTAGCPEAVEISGTISSDETWASQAGECPAYVVTGTVNVRAELRIEAGTTVLFRDAAAITVTNDGALRAEGTEQAPIVLRGTEDERGWWQGVHILTDRPTNRLFHVTIRNAGSTAFHGSVDPAGLTLGRSSFGGGVRVQDSTFENNAGSGIHIHSGATLNAFERNTLTGNAIPMTIAARHLVLLDDESTFAGNDQDNVILTGGSLSEGGTIPALDVPYRSSSFTLGGSDTITIAAGARFLMRDAASVEIHGQPTIIDGTAGAPVHFSATEPEAGWWQGIFLRDGTSPENRFTHLVVEYAGESALHGSVEPAGIAISRSSFNASVALEHVTVRNSAGYGLFAHSNGAITGWESLIFEDNGGPAASVVLAALVRIDEASTFTGNGVDAIEVRGGSTGTDGTWRNPGVPYRVTGSPTIEHDIAIEAGTAFVFDAERGLSVDGGRVEMTGTADDRITFVGATAEPGWWNGIFLRNTDGATSIIDHILVEDAGRSSFSGVNIPAGLAIGRTSGFTADVTVTNATFRNIGRATENEAAGIVVNSNSTVNADICTANTFEGINGPEDCVAP
ncbi:MAG: hypothetical protein EA398_06470 [Deltaproteobacteria bacterium]|nr:MAG: hypothetical protein EA398_06470 [Deltaproteobacteria bacterium]